MGSRPPKYKSPFFINLTSNTHLRVARAIAQHEKRIVQQQSFVVRLPL
jgi:hypothetical protein